MPPHERAGRPADVLGRSAQLAGRAGHRAIDIGALFGGEAPGGGVAEAQVEEAEGQCRGERGGDDNPDALRPSHALPFPGQIRIGASLCRVSESVKSRRRQTGTVTIFPRPPVKWRGRGWKMETVPSAATGPPPPRFARPLHRTSCGPPPPSLLGEELEARYAGRRRSLVSISSVRPQTIASARSGPIPGPS